MIVVALFVGLIGFLVVGAVTSSLLNVQTAGIMEGVVAAVWAMWPILSEHSVERYNQLHPVPRRYKVPLKQAFAKIRQIIGEKSYKYGDKWHISTADTVQRRITGTLRFSEEEKQFEAHSPSSMGYKITRLQRLLELDVQMKEEPGEVVIQFDFNAQIQGFSRYACDSIITGIVHDVEAALGPGSDAASASDTVHSAPPWWLLGVTVYGLIVLIADVINAVFKS